jgi:hypothetical protein
MQRYQRFGRFVVVESSAQMPSSCWGRYSRIGIVEMRRAGNIPAALWTHGRGIVRVVSTWERMHVGKTSRCASERAWAKACALAERLDAEHPERVVETCVCGSTRWVDHPDDTATCEACGHTIYLMRQPT